MDVTSAFLNGLIDTLIFLKQPEGFRLDDSVCKLHWSIYGLCQGARAWYDILNNVVQRLGFKRLVADLAVWIKTIDRNLQFIIAHVDDLLSGGQATEVKEVKEHFGGFFKLKDLGSAKVFIGMNITRDRIKRIIYIDEAHYGKAMLLRYEMSECNPISIPMQPGEKLFKAGVVLSTSETKTIPSYSGLNRIYDELHPSGPGLCFRESGTICV